jgi:methyltransferase (TIGR00027 family)
MELGQASVSAMGSGVLRAAHVKEDAPPWVFEDIVAERLLTDAELAEIERSMADWAPEVRAGFRLAHAVRARLAEDVAIEGLEVGRRDYVILGAGLDTFAWRHPRAAELEIWELDHPETQEWKRTALTRSGLGEPANVHFVSIDLSTAKLEEVNPPSLATWNWLGVTMYLKASATVEILRGIASGRPGTVLVVNFLLAADELDDLAAAVQSTSATVLTAVGEPLLASYTKEGVAALFSDSGFSSVELLAGRDLTERYLQGRPDLRLPSSTVIAVATV